MTRRTLITPENNNQPVLAGKSGPSSQLFSSLPKAPLCLSICGHRECQWWKGPGIWKLLQFLCESWHSKEVQPVERWWIKLMSQGKERSSDESGEMSVLINPGDVNTWVCVGLQGFGVSCPGFPLLPCHEWVFPDPLQCRAGGVGSPSGIGEWVELGAGLSWICWAKIFRVVGLGMFLSICPSISVGARGFGVSSCRRSAPSVPGGIVSSKPWKLRGKSNPTLRSCLKTQFLKWELRVFSALWGMGLSLPWVQVWLFH